MPDPQTPAAASTPTVSLDKLLPIVSNIVRWHLLRELASGDDFMVIELAERVGIKLDAASKHLAMFRDAGIVTQRRNRLYQIAPQFVADKSSRTLDFGHCLLRLESAI